MATIVPILGIGAGNRFTHREDQPDPWQKAKNALRSLGMTDIARGSLATKLPRRRPLKKSLIECDPALIQVIMEEKVNLFAWGKIELWMLSEHMIERCASRLLRSDDEKIREGHNSL
jgi:hypothetical protein